MADELLFEVKDRVAIMTLNRPEALNAFTPEVLTGWVRRLEEAQRRDDVNVLLVTGAGRGKAAMDRGERELSNRRDTV